MPLPALNERERRILEAVIQSYVETAEPTGSRNLARRFGFGVSPATIRNTMSDLEEKGYLYHPHTSAGRVPTDMAYRIYVDSLMRLAPPPPPPPDQDVLMEQLAAGGSAIETILRCAAQSLSVLTQELGIALGPRIEQAVLERVDLVRLSSERLLLVLGLRGGSVRTIFVEVAGTIVDPVLTEVSQVLNERLGGLTLKEIRASLASRLRDTTPSDGAGELLSIFVQSADTLFEAPLAASDNVVLGAASVLAEQPEFASGESLRRLIALTETRQQLADLLRKRTAPSSGLSASGISITIGNEHADPRLENLTIVTAEYRAGPLGGVIGVIGPTRMSYEKVISLVSHTSQMISALFA